MTAEIDGPALFGNGLDMMTGTLETAGSYTLLLHPAPGAMPAQPFTLDVMLSDINIQRNGIVAHPIYLPAIIKPS